MYNVKGVKRGVNNLQLMVLEEDKHLELDFSKDSHLFGNTMEEVTQVLKGEIEAPAIMDCIHTSEPLGIETQMNCEYFYLGDLKYMLSDYTKDCSGAFELLEKQLRLFITLSESSRNSRRYVYNWKDVGFVRDRARLIVALLNLKSGC